MLKFLPSENNQPIDVSLLPCAICAYGELVSICFLPPQKIPPGCQMPNSSDRIRAEICHADGKTGFSDTTVTVIRDCVYPFCGGTAQSGSLYDRLSLPSWSRGDTRTPWDSKTAVSSAADEDEFECQHRLVTSPDVSGFFSILKMVFAPIFGLFEHTSLQHGPQWNAPNN